MKIVNLNSKNLPGSREDEKKGIYIYRLHAFPAISLRGIPKNSPAGIIAAGHRLIEGEDLHFGFPTFFIFPFPQLHGIFVVQDTTIGGICTECSACTLGNIGQQAKQYCFKGLIYW
jgi:hypothetical protein